MPVVATKSTKNTQVSKAIGSSSTLTIPIALSISSIDDAIESVLNQSQDVAVDSDKCHNHSLETQAEIDSLKAIATLSSKVSFLLSYLELEDGMNTISTTSTQAQQALSDKNNFKPKKTFAKMVTDSRLLPSPMGP